MAYTNREKMKEALREVGLRQFVYSRKVIEGKMKQEDAERRISKMAEIAADYKMLADQDEAEERLL